MQNRKFKKYFKFLVVIFSFSFLIFNLSIANAAIVPCGGLDCTICHLFAGVKNLVNFFTLQIAMPAAVVVLIYGGLMFVMSGGSPAKRDKGRAALQYAILGMAIVFGAWLIVDTVLRVLASPGQLPKFWTTFEPCG